jgi:imidazole glycerol-phosphate synthase subunit HisH
VANGEAKRSVLVVDTGMGNVRSVLRALERAGASPDHSRDPDRIAAAERLVVPGQGHFADCARAFDGGLGESVRAFLASGRPYLGICLGMQILFDASDEAPGMRGLGVFGGHVRRFASDLRDASGERLKVPHMGWSEVTSTHPFLAGAPWLYFVHSFHCVPSDPAIVAATADYGGPFCAAVARDNVFACQFHPEKSQHAGAALLSRFVVSR